MMKHLLRVMLTTFCLVVFTATAFADGTRMTVYENADLSTVQRIAIGMPQYYPTGENAPTVNDLMGTMFESSRVSKIMILSYDDIASNIKRDKHIDIKQLPRKKAMAIYAENVGKYADAYVIATVTNGKRLQMFFEVGDAKTFAGICDYRATASRGDVASAFVFKELSEEFFRAFDSATKKQITDREEAEKASAKAEKEAVKAALKKSKASKK